MKKEIIKVRVTKAEHELAKTKAQQMGASVSAFLAEALHRTNITRPQFDAAMVKAKNFTKSDLMRMIIIHSEVQTRLAPTQVDAILGLADAINNGRTFLSEKEGGETLVERLNELINKLFKTLS